ncbi:MAG TPA: PfkB family carbohydrate kinase [Bacilli bacterium]|nr:PfkB family carbohydrate kinase [Bacilli bacterium]
MRNILFLISLITFSFSSQYTFLVDKYDEDKVIVVTLEEHGALYSQDGIIKLMPALNVVAKDTTGAGDIFHGAFVYGLANNFDLEKTIKYATVAGGLSVTKLGARNSVPDLKEVEAEYTKNN